MPPAAVFRSRRAAQYIIPDCRARMFQFAFERALLPFKQDKPLLPTPLFRLPKASPTDRTPTHKHRTTQIKGALPLWAAYAAHSPRFPFGESRARKPQYTDERALTPYKQDKPPRPTPSCRMPKASHSRTPTVPAFS